MRAIITGRADRDRILFPIRDINPTRIFPLLTLALIAANVAVFFALQPFTDEAESEEFFYEYAAIACELQTGDPLDLSEIQEARCEEDSSSPVFPDKNVYVAGLVSMFLHGGIAHLGFNMWSLWIFGNNVEEAFGRVGYLAMYLLTGVVATLGFVALNLDSTVPLVGASGAIAGVMGAYLVLFPTHRIMTIVFFYLTAVPAAFFLAIWFLLQFSVAGAETNVAWEAHVFGFLAGVAITLPLRPLLLRRTAEAQRPVATGPFFGR